MQQNDILNTNELINDRKLFVIGRLRHYLNTVSNNNGNISNTHDGDDDDNNTLTTTY